MERERPREQSDQKLEALRRELTELRKKKKQKDLMEKKASLIISAVQEEKQHYIPEPEIPEDAELISLEKLESRLNKLDSALIEQANQADQQIYKQHAQYIESELNALEQEINTEKTIIEEKIAPFELLLKEYPWLEEKRFEYMYSIPDKKKNKRDFESWRQEWAKILFDYAKYAIFHILYIRKLNSEKPFSKFTNREESIKEIAEELIDQKLAEWLSRKKEQLRVYWKTLEGWADEIYKWAYEFGKLGPILIYEIREANEEFSNLPKDDLEAIFKILSKDDRGEIIKTDDGQIALKIKVE